MSTADTREPLFFCIGCGHLFSFLLDGDSALPGDGRALYAQWDKEMFQAYLERSQLPRGQKLKQYSRSMTMKLTPAVSLLGFALAFPLTVRIFRKKEC